MLTSEIASDETFAAPAQRAGCNVTLPPGPSGKSRQPMPRLRRWALAAYYGGSLPYRWCFDRWTRARGRAPIMALLMHRVADDGANSWTTSSDEFVRQMRWLKANFDLVSLAEAQQRIAQKSNDRPCVAVTFDDGYEANCRFAIPLLLREKIPCTYFVVTDHVLHRKPFSHDIEMGNAFAPNSAEQLRDMAASGIDIGVHTRTHLDLGPVDDPDIVRQEMVAARDELQDALGVRPRYFSFPFGRHQNLTRLAFRIAREAEYAGVCSAYGGYNYPGDDPFHIQRCGIDQALIRAKNWATGDPLRQLSIRRFQYA